MKLIVLNLSFKEIIFVEEHLTIIRQFDATLVCRFIVSRKRV